MARDLEAPPAPRPSDAKLQPAIFDEQGRGYHHVVDVTVEDLAISAPGIHPRGSLKPCLIVIQSVRTPSPSGHAEVTEHASVYQRSRIRVHQGNWMYGGLTAYAVAMAPGIAKPLVGQTDRQQELLPVHVLEPTLPLQQFAEPTVGDLDRDTVAPDPAGGGTG